MEKINILLAMPENFNLVGQIKKNLEYCGFNVWTLGDKSFDESFQYPNVKIHIRHFLRKNFLRDRSIKNELKREWHYQKTAELIGERIFDYILVIRPDLFTNKLIGLLRQHTKNTLVGYQWDGFDRFPEVFDKISLFDRFFVFDQRDLQHHPKLPLLGITNFYFDNYPPIKTNHKKKVAYFIGSHLPERVSIIVNCARTLTNMGIEVNFMIGTPTKAQQKSYQNEKITFLTKVIDFEANLKQVINADILFDFTNPVHQGLSFRIFEALYYGKKLITDNPTVKDYDFYHPNNIFVWDGKELSGLPEFLALPLQPIDANIVKKYSFSNWIKNILDIPPYQQIELPNTPKSVA